MDNCEHKFKVIRTLEGDVLLQFLYCKRCGNYYLGSWGSVGEPKLIHQVPKSKVFEKTIGVSL